MVDSGKVPHAIMLHEDDGGGGVSIALSFLQYLYCSHRSAGDSCGQCPSCTKIAKMVHPDVHFVFPTVSSSEACLSQWRSVVSSNPFFGEHDLMESLGIEKKSAIISVAEAQKILSTLSLSALEGGYRSVLIYLPEKMNREAGNRLLKMIEEPPELTQFVLVTHAPEMVLGTIASRCQRLRVAPAPGASAPAAASGFAPLLDSLFAALASRDLMAALDAGEKIAALPSRENVKAFCKFASGELRRLFIAQQGLTALAAPEAGVCAPYASSLRKTFPRMALAAFDRALLMTGRNVNLKIVFTELVDSLYQNV